jgi:hypothetical protein
MAKTGWIRFIVPVLPADVIAKSGDQCTSDRVLSREDCCVRVFECARDFSVKTIYQIPSAYWRVAVD